jgi:hypothetical protein
VKTIVCLRHVTVAMGLSLLSNAGCAENEKVAAAPLPPAKELPAAPVTGVPVADARWREIKDLSYDSRAAFFAGFKRLQARLDEQISELSARRAAMKGDADTKDWDFAMKEVGNARSYLTGTGEIVAKATSESWAQDRERVGQAWLRAQAACARVKASTTI